MSRESASANILVQTNLGGRVEHVPVADETHSIDVVVIFVVVGSLAEKGDGCCHLEEAVPQELETLVILTHAFLNMHLQSSVLFGVVRVLGEGFQSIVCPDI